MMTKDYYSYWFAIECLCTSLVITIITMLEAVACNSNWKLEYVFKFMESLPQGDSQKAIMKNTNKYGTYLVLQQNFDVRIL